MSAFGERLSEARDKKKLSQSALAKLVGVRQAYISELERGEKDNPGAAVVARLESALEMVSGSLSQYLTGGVPVFHATPVVKIVREGDFDLPLLGGVSAGKPRDPAIDADQWSFNEHLGGEGRFLLRVEGVSMSGDGIQNGDLVVVQPDRQGENGQLVVGWSHYGPNPSAKVLALKNKLGIKD